MRFGILAAFSVATVLALSATAAAQDEEEDDSSPEWDFEAYLEEAHSWGDITIRAGPDFMQLDWAGIELGDQASRDLRALADGALSDDSDGTVDADEADQFLGAVELLFENGFAKLANHHSVSGIVLIDHAEASEADLTDFDVVGLVGPVDSGETITASFGLRVEFPNVDEGKDVHTVKIDLGPHLIKSGGEDEAAQVAGDLTITVQGADGWEINPDTVEPPCAADTYDAGRLVFDSDDIGCFTGHKGVLLAFEITGEGQEDANFLPGVGVPALLAGLALLGVALRRRA